MKKSKCHIVLFQPEIPSNTGNIARTCVGFDLTLHLIKPYGFNLNEKNVRRAGLDYWKFLKLKEYDDFSDFLEKNLKAKIFIITKFGDKFLNEVSFPIDVDTYFLFGQETKGLPKEIMELYKNNAIRIPMINIRSFNLSNVVAMVANHYQMTTNYLGLNISEK